MVKDEGPLEYVVVHCPDCFRYLIRVRGFRNKGYAGHETGEQLPALGITHTKPESLLPRGAVSYTGSISICGTTPLRVDRPDIMSAWIMGGMDAVDEITLDEYHRSIGKDLSNL